MSPNLLTDIRLTDFRGNEFGVGDTVLYPRMSGRSCEITEGVVLGFKPYEDEEYILNPNYDPSRERNWSTNPPSLREKFTNYRVYIEPLRSSRGFYRSRDDDGKHDPVYVSIKENIVKA